MQARFWQWPYWDKQSIYFTARNEVTPDGTLRWRIYHDKFRNALDSFDNATYSSFNRPYAFEGSTYDDFTVGGNADFEWRWTDAQTTRTALHLKRDVHREVDEVAAPSERYEDRTYALAIEHGWEVAENVVLTPGYAYTVQDGREAENNVNGTVTPFPPTRQTRTTPSSRWHGPFHPRLRCSPASAARRSFRRSGSLLVPPRIGGTESGPRTGACDALRDRT